MLFWVVNKITDVPRYQSYKEMNIFLIMCLKILIVLTLWTSNQFPIKSIEWQKMSYLTHLITNTALFLSLATPTCSFLMWWNMVKARLLNLWPGLVFKFVLAGPCRCRILFIILLAVSFHLLHTRLAQLHYSFGGLIIRFHTG